MVKWKTVFLQNKGNRIPNGKSSALCECDDSLLQTTFYYQHNVFIVSAFVKIWNGMWSNSIQVIKNLIAFSPYSNWLPICDDRGSSSYERLCLMLFVIIAEVCT